MKTKHQYLLIFFWVALLADSYFIFEERDASRIYTKALLMPLLIIYFIVNAAPKHHLPSRILAVTALIFAWVGDIFLLKPGQNNFIIGLASFLVMHLVYSIYFLRINSLFPIKKPLNIWVPLFGVAIFDAVLMNFLLPEAGDLKYPLIAYTAVISLMLVFACNTKGSKKAGTLAGQFFIPGALFFIASDSILGFNMFILEDNLVNIAVMLTYGFAQTLMVHGFIKHVKGRT